jgi:hypothetical protein
MCITFFWKSYCETLTSSSLVLGLFLLFPYRKVRQRSENVNLCSNARYGSFQNSQSIDLYFFKHLCLSPFSVAKTGYHRLVNLLRKQVYLSYELEIEAQQHSTCIWGSLCGGGHYMARQNRDASPVLFLQSHYWCHHGVPSLWPFLILITSKGLVCKYYQHINLEIKFPNMNFVGTHSNYSILWWHLCLTVW